MINEKKKKIQDIEITQLELAEILNLSIKRIYELSELDILDHSPRGKYNLKKSVQKYINYRIEYERNIWGDIDKEAKRARREKEIAEAELKRIDVQIKEIDLDVLRGKLIPIDKVIEDDQKIISLVRTRILAISAKVAPLLIGLRSIKRIKTIIDPELHEALNELSRIKKV